MRSRSDGASTILRISTTPQDADSETRSEQRAVQKGSGTHETKPSFMRGSIFISLPPSSNGGVISNAWRSIATFMKSAASLKWRPGQILRCIVERQSEVREMYVERKSEVAYLRPKPNTNWYGSRVLASSFPSRINRSGRNTSGFGYASGSCIHALFTTNQTQLTGS